MDSELAIVAERLIERANHLRQLALYARSRGIGAELERIARSYEVDAVLLELQDIPTQPGFIDKSPDGMEFP